MTSSREQFEEWFKSKYPQTADIHLNVTGGGSDFAKAIYSAWQASRHCIEVELPEVEDPANFFCEVYDTYKIQQAMTSAGIKIKGA